MVYKFSKLRCLLIATRLLRALPETCSGKENWKNMRKLTNDFVNASASENPAQITKSWERVSRNLSQIFFRRSLLERTSIAFVETRFKIKIILKATDNYLRNYYLKVVQFSISEDKFPERKSAECYFFRIHPCVKLSFSHQDASKCFLSLLLVYTHSGWSFLFITLSWLSQDRWRYFQEETFQRFSFLFSST
jgi:hypothetical protein